VSEENVEIARRVLCDFADTGQLPRDAFAPNVFLDVSTWWGWVGEQQYEGFGPLCEFFASDIKRDSEGTFQLERLQDAGGSHVIAIIYERMAGERWYALIFTFSRGLIERVDAWSSPDEARHALGLQE
jgi:hypothetical protein